MYHAALIFSGLLLILYKVALIFFGLVLILPDLVLILSEAGLILYKAAQKSFAAVLILCKMKMRKNKGCLKNLDVMIFMMVKRYSKTAVCRQKQGFATANCHFSLRLAADVVSITTRKPHFHFIISIYSTTHIAARCIFSCCIYR